MLARGEWDETFFKSAERKIKPKKNAIQSITDFLQNL